jgi:hypothetical protein
MLEVTGTTHHLGNIPPTFFVINILVAGDKLLAACAKVAWQDVVNSITV